MRLSDNFLLELKSRNDIESVISSYVTLKRSGRNLKGLCPFHGEKTASFTVYPDSASFYCFGCGTGGDVIRFIRLIENLDYMDAVKFLAERSGMEMPTEGFEDNFTKTKNTIYAINRETAKFFHTVLTEDERGKRALEYFRDRGLNEKTIRHFGLGYAPDSWDSLLKHLKGKGFTEGDILLANLVSKGKSGGLYDRFRDRIMFPILDVRGNVIAFGGRKTPWDTRDSAKYINTSDTPVYKKSHNVYALNFAKNYCDESIILCEGYMDVIALHQAGFQNAVAPLGTALTIEQARLLSRYTREVIITLDGDAAGQKATDRAMGVFAEAGVKVRIVQIPEGSKDPDEFIKNNGADGYIKFKALLNGSVNDVEFKLYKASQNFDISTDDGRVKFLQSAANILGGVSSEIEREVYAGRLSEQYNVSKSTLLTEAAKYAKREGARQAKDEIRRIISPKSNGPLDMERRKNPKAANAEDGLLSILIRNPKQIGIVKTQITPETFVVSLNKKLYETLIKAENEGRQFDITLAHDEFTDEELGKIAEILAKEEHRPATRSESEFCINIMMQEQNYQEKVSKLDDDDFAQYINKLKEKKK